MTARHTRQLPPHAEHLPERFGLFTLILLGESIVAIMKGIQAQPNWTPSAAGAALLGIGLIFTCWWAYFDWARAATTRRIDTARDARRFEIWNYAHLPLYLGLALTAVGVEHIVKLGGMASLRAEEVLLLGSAIATDVLALIVLAATADRTPALHRRPEQSSRLRTVS